MRKPTRFGKYVLLDRIAVGGMAEVFVAKAFGVEGFQRLLAIKRILPSMSEDREFIHMFVDEARIAAQLSHANIVQVLELGKHEETLYIAMEYVAGRDLRQIMEGFRKWQQPIPVPQVCLIMAEVCEALDYAHRKRDSAGRPLGIVHRDVSPQNVLVSYDGVVKLIDFGIAKAESRVQKATQAGILKGKFSYMSPEQVQGHAVDARSDIFACGVLLWEMLSGEKLFVGDSDLAVLDKIRNGIIPPLQTSCPMELQRIVAKALASDPARRYQTASELHDELVRFTRLGASTYGPRQLADWIREHFHASWEQEQQRSHEWSTVARTPPGAIRTDGPEEVTMALPASQRRSFDDFAEGTRARRSARRAAASRPARASERRSSRRYRFLYLLGPAAALALVAMIALLDAADSPPSRSRLVVTRTPPVDAELTLDGRSAGALPVVRNVLPGPHHIEVMAPGFKPFSADIDVPRHGKPIEVDAQLAPTAPMRVEGLVLTQPRTTPARKR